jgi:hypothetical protein
MSGVKRDKKAKNVPENAIYSLHGTDTAVSFGNGIWINT